ncbi:MULTISPECIES: hypothetical protein [Burkholderia]|uniref:hypothetical protein n=1 Tax=Burkholderia TaxID=32008 RepID=UPI0011A45CC8|nr:MULTISPECIES: hypothetical protein [Burkholderia]MCQ0034657.1 hypothetical protein [Burkholderia glumae]MCQ0040250.1 hypothetical protein [Burkholderia glumae]
MTRTTVYRYRWWDVSTDSNEVRPMRGTREAIGRISGEIIEESAEDIDASLLDGNGFIPDDQAK